MDRREHTPAPSDTLHGQEKVCIAWITGEATATELSSALARAGIPSETTDVTCEYHDFRLDRPPFRVPAEDRSYEVLVSAADTVKAKQILHQKKAQPIREEVVPAQRRFVRIVANIGGFFAPFFLFSVVYMIFGSDVFMWILCALLAAFSGVVLVFSHVVSRRPEREQRARQERADRIADALQAGSCDEEFCLFLRSFSKDGAMTRRLFLRSPSFFDFGRTRSEVIDLEEVFSVALDDLGLPLVAIGEPSERFGSAQLPSDDETWKQLAARAMDEAPVILMTPGASVGTLWEGEYIVSNGLLEKCFFVMPPATKEAEWDAHWSQVLEAGFRWTIPPYTAGGMLFRVRSDGSIEWKDSLPRKPSIENVRKLLRRGFA